MILLITIVFITKFEAHFYDIFKLWEGIIQE